MTPLHHSQIRKYLGGHLLHYPLFYTYTAINIAIREITMVRIYTRLEIA